MIVSTNTVFLPTSLILRRGVPIRRRLFPEFFDAVESAGGAMDCASGFGEILIDGPAFKRCKKGLTRNGPLTLLPPRSGEPVSVSRIRAAEMQCYEI